MVIDDLSPQHLGDYESVYENGRWRIVRLSDGVRFAYTCPKSGRVTSGWGYRGGAESWIRVLRMPQYADHSTHSWEPPTRATGTECVPDLLPVTEPDDDFDEAPELASA